MAIIFRRERAQDIFEEAAPLLRQHYAEIAHYQDIPLEPDLAQYAAVEEAGCLRVFTARDDSGLIGYAVFFVRRNLHYRSSLQAVQDILYVDPGKRGFGARFIHWCDEQLRKESVQVVYHHVKAAHDFGALLERFGYQLVDKIYARRLDG